MGKRVVGIDIGGTNFRIGAVDKDGTVVDFRKLPVASVLQSDDVLSDLAEYLRSYISKLEDDVAAIAIGFPAPLDKERKTVLQAPNLPYMENLPVTDRLSELLGLPVLIERDVNMLLCYDVKAHALPEDDVICAFYFGTGLGNAIAIGGQIYVGKNGAAGELGHIPVDGSDELCGCGNVGCMENVAAGKHLAALAGSVYTDTPVDKLFLRHGGDEALLRFVDRMAMAVATELNILDPDHVLVGGGVPAMEAFPRDYLCERICAHARKPYPANRLNIIFVAESMEKGVIGAALYAFNKII